MSIVQIRADSLSPGGYRFTSFEITLPKSLLAQLNKHRAAANNTASSRAIPVARMIANVKSDPYVPLLTLNQRGMVGRQLDDVDLMVQAQRLIAEHMEQAIALADDLADLGIHKQHANRYLEPFSYVKVLISGTEWGNFFNLRATEDTQGDFAVVAVRMKELYEAHTPTPIEYGQWHFPRYDNTAEEIATTEQLYQSVARNARLSYLTHNNVYSLDDDLRLHDILLKDTHLTPFEHISLCMPEAEVMLSGIGHDSDIGYSIPGPLIGTLLMDNNSKERYGAILYSRQFKGFYTYRHMIEDGNLHLIK